MQAALRETGNEPMFGALEAGMAPLSAYGIEMGGQDADRKTRQKRRRKGASA